jgi:hypothetical protein
VHHWCTGGSSSPALHHDPMDFTFELPRPNWSSAAIVLLVLVITLVGASEATLRDAAPTVHVSSAPVKAREDRPFVSLGDVRLLPPTIPYASISPDAGVGGSAILQSTAANLLAAPIPGSPVHPGPPIPAHFTRGAIDVRYAEKFTFVR